MFPWSLVEGLGAGGRRRRLRDYSGVRSKESITVLGCLILGTLTALSALLTCLRAAHAYRACWDARVDGSRSSSRLENARRRATTMHLVSVATCALMTCLCVLNLVLDVSVGHGTHGRYETELTLTLFVGPLSFYAWLCARERSTPVFFRAKAAWWLRPFCRVLIAAQAFVFVSIEIGDALDPRHDTILVFSTAFVLDVGIVVVATVLFLLPFVRRHPVVPRRRSSSGDSTLEAPDDPVAVVVRRTIYGTLLYLIAWILIWAHLFLYASVHISYLASAYYLSTVTCVVVSHRDDSFLGSFCKQTTVECDHVALSDVKPIPDDADDADDDTDDELGLQRRPRGDTSFTDALGDALGTRRHHTRSHLNHNHADARPPPKVEDHKWDGNEEHGIGHLIEARRASRGRSIDDAT